MTEEEAKQKWCPMVRIPYTMDPGAFVHNRDADGYISASLAYKCIASDCMMWRWEDEAIGMKKHGYCGLAGKL